jgi:hypothetical protein
MTPKLVHCSYHKCLTVYCKMVFSKLYNRMLKFSKGYRHFESLIEDFYEESDNYKIASVNNHVLDLSRLGENFRVTRLIRDPRDLVISGYFYHKRGAEAWCNIVNPGEEDWKVVNGCIPEKMGKDHSFASYLNRLSKEEGLMAEIEFRRKHFESMKGWPVEDHKIKLFRYEDIIGNECDVFEELFSFYGVSWLEKRLGLILVDRFSAKKQVGKIQHIRNPTTNQWKGYFTPRVRDHFEELYGEILERYGYE